MSEFRGVSMINQKIVAAGYLLAAQRVALRSAARAI